METDDIINVKYTLNYLKVALKISKLRYQGDDPTNELLQHAYEMGRLAGVSEDELKNL